MEVTGTFKQMKMKLVEEGFDPAFVQDPLYVLDDGEKSYTPMTAQLYSRIISGSLKLWLFRLHPCFYNGVLVTAFKNGPGGKKYGL